jgi:hypothetical protein
MRKMYSTMLLVIVAVVAMAEEHCQKACADTVEPMDKALLIVKNLYEKAFNYHDAAALSTLWAQNAVHYSKTTGAELRGNLAIGDSYSKLFREDPKCKLTLYIKSAKANTPESATLTGVAEVEHTGKTTTRSYFDAKLLRIGTNWLFERVDETDLPAEVHFLSWLVGTWSEDLPSGRVVNQFHWVDGGAFLLRNYWREVNEGPSVQGTQIYGWDPEQHCIRTWLFDSSGSFGEGYWHPNGNNRWHSKLVVKLPDGRRGSVTQIVERLTDDELALRSIDREIDGEAQPREPEAKMRRISDDTLDSTAAAKEGK